MTERRMGQWPVAHPSLLAGRRGGELSNDPEATTADALSEPRAAERALHEMVLDSIRHDLEQQPSPLTVVTAARNWCSRITAAAEDVAQAKRRAA